ncbi:hypothetical protein EVAR_24671_1 [Eumeta japonica]|uniref:Uncharacterized protein n=1 Tax=Eumeta variegata TaxID=151549 RepID=A0A4C1WD90_EUMVA|nr:hypothetical protein EVAR_24671_1 [Eumeta japonica]
MRALLLDTCCECVELRTGCLIIGYLQLVFEIVGATFLLMGLTVGPAVASVVLRTDCTESHTDDAQGRTLLFICAVSLLAIVLGLAFTITLLVGVHMNKRRHVKAYLIYLTIFLMLSVVMFFVSLSSIKYNTDGIIGYYISCALNAYFLLVVRSYYYRMNVDRPTVIDTAHARPIPTIESNCA